MIKRKSSGKKSSLGNFFKKLFKTKDSGEAEKTEDPLASHVAFYLVYGPAVLLSKYRVESVNLGKTKIVSKYSFNTDSGLLFAWW